LLIAGDAIVHGARFPDRLRLPHDFDPDRLAADMAAVAAAGWTEHSSSRTMTATGA
jgi:hypothetical protein